MLTFLYGSLTMSCVVSATFFLRFYRDTRERLFVVFAAAFGVLAVHWTLLSALRSDDEHRPHAYLLRMLAFALILVGIIDKNRREP